MTVSVTVTVVIAVDGVAVAVLNVLVLLGVEQLATEGSGGVPGMVTELHRLLAKSEAIFWSAAEHDFEIQQEMSEIKDWLVQMQATS